MRADDERQSSFHLFFPFPWQWAHLYPATSFSMSFTLVAPMNNYDRRAA